MAALVFADSKAIVYKLLSENEDLVAQGIEVYGPPGMPKWFTLRKAIFFASNGGMRTEVPIGRETYQFRCYGETFEQANEVYRWLSQVLHRHSHIWIEVEAGIEALFQYASQTSGPNDMREPETGWPFVLAMFEVHTGERLLEIAPVITPTGIVDIYGNRLVDVSGNAVVGVL